MRVSTIVGVVIILVALAIGYAVVVLGGNYNLYKYNKRSLQGRLDVLSSAVQDYVQAHDGQVPSSFQALVSGKYIDSVPSNPFTGNGLQFVMQGGWHGSDDIEITSLLVEDDSHEVTVYCKVITMTAYNDDGDVLAETTCQVMVPEDTVSSQVE